MDVLTLAVTAVDQAVWSSFMTPSSELEFEWTWEPYPYKGWFLILFTGDLLVK